ncbi:ABC transporter substrate-binding protein [Microbacterium azadirachtae]|uniref:Amino acid ABC transporter substrate-binding protein, PAAT family n=1 Tax=Microbacterium azadirachtae TaxID=582680 RepID=A0A1I6G611_9MICO|nr:ABC transporter substrate-binding protein [Microbacterium azadirachtae]SDL35147.1 amino acid ABC transporter substrate-binding protein, PAAT family [Microbacterium azadirachtae]SEF65819.1 amino acid ABC transporter substrate-binding protein, PAAT family [Microbacterium azadirachtae]SEF66621.1 amino acid ABC transporter substrate-binding protein, PAAT family [Microbacterium azadirachtae]SFR37590.1 amino acid ABC transporter substrate-binding protein, PAAT family [Microbacterium azadirachtae]
MKRITIVGTVAVATLMAGLTGCANPTDAAGTPSPQNTDLVASVTRDAKIAAMLPSDIKERGTITVSINTDVAPLKFLDANGNVTGLNPELLQTAGKVLGVNVQFHTMSFDALMPSLEAKQSDIVGSVSDFVERQKTTDFIDYLESGSALLASTALKQNALTLNDLCGLKVAYVRGSSQQATMEKADRQCAADGKTAIAISTYPDLGAGVLAVKSGAEDAFLSDLSAMSYKAKTDPKSFKIVYTEKKTILGIGIRKDDPVLRDALRAALLKLVDDGVYASLLDRWGQQDFGNPSMNINTTKTMAGK